jgi:hypothetical protein
MMRKISTFFQKNEKWLTPTALIGGFVIDNVTLRRSDLLMENLLLAFYFVVVFAGVLFFHVFEQRKKRTISHNEKQSIIFLITQFAFGGLFSSLTVFYIKSASLFASWPFLLLLFGGMIATEYFKKHFTQFVVQLATLYVLLFTYLIMVTPLFVRAINVWVFLLSGVLSLIVIVAYIFVFQGFVPALFEYKQKYVLYVVGGIYVLMNVFYFTNIIPPIPLALRDSGVYSSIQKKENTYLFSDFKSKFSIRDFKKEYTVPANSPVYFYSAVYAPIKFQQKIVHEWQKKNQKGEWVTVSVVDFSIFGGSDTGYRGYSISSRVTKGEYRVLVKTERGQVLGGENFLIK